MSCELDTSKGRSFSLMYLVKQGIGFTCSWYIYLHLPYKSTIACRYIIIFPWSEKKTWSPKEYVFFDIPTIPSVSFSWSLDSVYTDMKGETWPHSRGNGLVHVPYMDPMGRQRTIEITNLQSLTLQVAVHSLPPHPTQNRLSLDSQPKTLKGNFTPKLSKTHLLYLFDFSPLK